MNQTRPRNRAVLKDCPLNPRRMQLQLPCPRSNIYLPLSHKKTRYLRPKRIRKGPSRLLRVDPVKSIIEPRITPTSTGMSFPLPHKTHRPSLNLFIPRLPCLTKLKMRQRREFGDICFHWTRNMASLLY